jgi:UPF0716 family protein affecting phage T7 exclusion
MKNLFLLGALVALADPALLYVIWANAGAEVALAVALLPLFLGPRLVTWARAKARNRPQDPPAIPDTLGDEILLTAAAFLFAFPGPLTTLLALLLLIPAVRRWVQGRVLNRFKQAVASGGMTVMGGGNSFVVSSVSGFNPGFGPVSAGPSGPLKQAEGRVVDDTSLPPPTASLPPPGEK